MTDLTLRRALARQLRFTQHLTDAGAWSGAAEGLLPIIAAREAEVVGSVLDRIDALHPRIANPVPNSITVHLCGADRYFFPCPTRRLTAEIRGAMADARIIDITRLRNALETIDSLTDEVATLLIVAATDVSDVYGDNTITEAINPSGWYALDAEWRASDEGRRVRRLARMLCERMIHTPEIVLTYVKEDSDAQ